MPYKSERCKIAGTKYDKRRKLTEEQKAEIAELVGLSTRELLACMEYPVEWSNLFNTPNACNAANSAGRIAAVGDSITIGKSGQRPCTNTAGISTRYIRPEK